MTTRTPANLAAAIERIFELTGRVQHVELLLEGVQRQLADQTLTMRQLRIVTDHVLRMVRQKESLFELVGRVVLENRATMPVSQDFTPEQRADMARALAEMGPAVRQ